MRACNRENQSDVLQPWYAVKWSSGTEITSTRWEKQFKELLFWKYIFLYQTLNWCICVSYWLRVGCYARWGMTAYWNSHYINWHYLGLPLLTKENLLQLILQRWIFSANLSQRRPPQCFWPPPWLKHVCMGMGGPSDVTSFARTDPLLSM